MPKRITTYKRELKYCLSKELVIMTRNRIKVYFPTLLTLIFAFSITSCIDENLDDCGYVSIGFDYSYNMLSANAFESQADFVTLYVFDSNGKLVMKETSGDTPITNDFVITTKDLTFGKYQFVAWAKSNRLKNSDADFDIPDLTVGVSELDDLNYYLKRTSGIQNHELNNLLIGITEAEITNSPATQNVRVALKKVNKKIRVILLPYGGESNALDANKYVFSIVDKIGNGHVNYDYSLLQDEPVTYRPYYAANITSNPSEVLDPKELKQAIAVEINTSRLMSYENESDNPRLKITSKENNEDLVSVNLPWLLSLTGMESHKSWGIQEYLDRQNEYVITLFVQEDTWMKATIIINGWVLNNVEIDM